MKYKGIFFLVLLVTIIISIGIVSASDADNTTADIVAQSSEIDLTEINEESNLEISQDNQLSSQEENYRVIYVGQNKTSDGGNGSYENPYGSLKLASNNLSGENKAEINIFEGNYYLTSELIFNTNNLYINGIGENVIIENLDDGNTASLSFPTTTKYYNYTISNIIFKDCNNIWDNFIVMDARGIGIFNNCTFIAFSGAMKNMFFYWPGCQKFYNCNFIDISKYCLNNVLGENDVLELNYCILQNSFSSDIIYDMDYSANVFFDSCFFGQNSLPEYIKVKKSVASGGARKYAGFDIPVNRYAVFSAYENYLGNNTYEIIGKLVWNDSSSEGIEKLNPINFKLSSTTGDIQNNVTLINGAFKVVYKSNSKNNVVYIDLGSQKYPLKFNNDIEVSANPIFYGENQAIFITLANTTNSIVNITVNNITYSIKVNDSNSFNFTVPDELLAGIYQVTVEFADSVTHNYGFNSTTWIISKINKELFILTPADANVDDKEINLTILLENDASGNITVISNNKNLTHEVNGGEVNIDISSLLVGGDNNVTVIYSGNKKYTSQNKTEIISVGKIYPDINVTIPSNLTTADIINLEVNLPTNVTGNITITINEKNLIYQVTANKLSIDISDMVIGGNNEIHMFYSGDDWWDKQVIKDKIFVDKISPQMRITLLETVHVDEVSTFLVNLSKDASGNITIKLGTNIYTYPVIGESTPFNIIFNKSGVNSINITYEGNDKYYSESEIVNIIVLKINLGENDTNLSINSSITTCFGIVLPADATGNLTVTIGDNDYVQELVNGSALVVIEDLIPGNYNAILTYSGDNKYELFTKNASVSVPKPVLTAKNFSMLYTSGSKYTVHVTIDGKPVSGKPVTFTINGKKTTANTDKNGYASVKIDLPPKTSAYTVTATYLGVKITNKVTVKSIITAKNMNVKKSAKTLKIQVTLKKVNNKYLKGKYVTLKFNGKTYKVKTNSKGVATFTINKNVLNKLKVGKKYTYKVTYGKDTVNKKITVKK